MQEDATPYLEIKVYSPDESIYFNVIFSHQRNELKTDDSKIKAPQRQDLILEFLAKISLQIF